MSKRKTNGGSPIATASPPATPKPGMITQQGTHFLTTEEDVRQRAYQIFLERGQTAGSPEADWLQAEWELSHNGRGNSARM